MTTSDKRATSGPLTVPDDLEEDAELLADSILGELNIGVAFKNSGTSAVSHTCMIRISPRLDDISVDAFERQRVTQIRRRFETGDYKTDHLAIAQALLSKVCLFS